MLPHLIIPGAAKAGTTSLYHWLNYVDDITMPSSKEIHFYDVDEHWNMGPTFYADKFEQSKLRVDVSPGYFENSSVVIPRLLETYREKPPKAVILLRNPLERVCSYWNFDKCYGEQPMGLDDCILNHGETQLLPKGCINYMWTSLYAERLESWINALGSENVKVFLTDDLRAAPEKVMLDVLEHAGSSCVNVSHIKFKRHLEASRPRSIWLKNLLNSQDAQLKKIGKFFIPESKRRSVVQGLRIFNSVKTRVAVPSEDTMAYMKSFFADDILRLQAILGRSLDVWL